MHEASYYKSLEGTKVQCQLCPRKCIISDNNTGACGVRINKNGRLFSAVYGKPTGTAVDPIEKKPLYHFLPGSRVLSFGTIGCNLFCQHCQNFHISRATLKQLDNYDFVEPEHIVQQALDQNCQSIAYTYNEPTVFLEYAIDIAKIAKKHKLKNVSVTNGYINQEPLKDFIRYLDAANVDLKAFTNEFYDEIAKVKDFSPILETMKTMKKAGVWLEVTNLIIPGYNDKEEDMKRLIDWVSKDLGKDTPLHFTAFYPQYKLTKTKPTPVNILKKAHALGKQKLDFVYAGNVQTDKEGNTYCPKCDSLLVERKGFYSKTHIKDGKCKCGHKIPGVWK